MNGIFMSEKGEPLLLSQTNQMYDDAAMAVDQNFAKKFHFLSRQKENKEIDGKTGMIGKIYAVRPIIERETEYNRLNSSHNDTEHS